MMLNLLQGVGLVGGSTHHLLEICELNPPKVEDSRNERRFVHISVALLCIQDSFESFYCNGLLIILVQFTV